MQSRIGPAYTGPAGILQPIADFIKLLIKEDIVPYGARASFYRVAPLIAFFTTMLALLLIPIDGEKVISRLSFEGDLLLILALMLISDILLFLSGWSSRNPLSVIGATRILIQLIGCDFPFLLSALSPAILSRSLNIEKIVNAQAIPFALIVPWSFFLALITLQAKLEKDPFDIPYAETEIVAGYETEYSGRTLALIMATKDIRTMLGAALIVSLFLGGGNGPITSTDGLQHFWSALWFILKLVIVLFIIEYIACASARLRIDQAVKFNWKILLPSSLISLMLTAIISLTLWEVHSCDEDITNI